jgi:tRNA pseudouridine13 synthase
MRSSLEALPYLTDENPGIGGRIKVEPEDFVVEEISLYEPSGQGQHVYLLFEKRGLSTYQAISAIARRLSVSTGQVGYAGLKDARAVTRQMISIDGVEPTQVEDIDLPGVKILWVTRHRNKLKMGHLAGNRFTIRVRDVSHEARSIAEVVLGELGRRGVPNYFGAQRFGVRGNTHLLGHALLRDDADAFAHEYLGHPRPGDPQAVQAARAAFDAGDYQTALEKWPSSLRDERRVLAAIARRGSDAQQLSRLLDRKLRRLFVSAYQSHLFNRLLAGRVQTLDRLEMGDVAYIHANGAAFVVRDAEVEQPRADRFEISPSGPLFGPKTLLAEDRPGQQEQDLLRESGLSLDDFRLPGVKFKGARRPFRLPLSEVQVGWDDGLMLHFRLPSGGYATEVLREVMKLEQLQSNEA